MQQLSLAIEDMMYWHCARRVEAALEYVDGVAKARIKFSQKTAVAVLFPQWFPTQALAEAFWDVSTVVVALVVLGMALEVKAKGKTSEAIKKLIGLQARTARVVREGKELDIAVEKAVAGDHVVVRPGVQDAQGSKAPIQRVVDQVAAYLVPTVMIRGILAFMVWYTGRCVHRLIGGRLA